MPVEDEAVEQGENQRQDADVDPPDLADDGVDVYEFG